MDQLSDLPEKDTQKTQEEDAIITQLFGGEDTPSPSSSSTSSPSGMNWKLLGVGVCLFVLCANPWIDGMLGKIPKCEGSTMTFVVKTLLFIVLFAVSMYMLKK